MASSDNFPGFQEPDVLEGDISFGDGGIKDFLRCVSYRLSDSFPISAYFVTAVILGLRSMFSGKQITSGFGFDSFITFILASVISLLSIIYSSIKPYRRFKLLQQSMQLGYSDKRISQLQFSTWRKKNSRYFLSDLWFNIVE